MNRSSLALRQAKRGLSVAVILLGTPVPHGEGMCRAPAACGSPLGASSPTQWTASSADAATSSDGPGRACSRERIAHFARNAVLEFDYGRDGLLYGVATHVHRTRVGEMPGYNSCPLVASAILRRAGCAWLPPTENAEALYDRLRKRGWKPADRQDGGCFVVWNSRWKGPWSRVGDDQSAAASATEGVLYRQVGVTVNSWLAVDNFSLLSRPTMFFLWRPVNYHAPSFLCPPR